MTLGWRKALEKLVYLMAVTINQCNWPLSLYPSSFAPAAQHSLSSTESLCVMMHAYLFFTVSALLSVCNGVPVQDSPRQRLLKGLELPAGYRGLTGGKRLPFTPGHKDSNDNPVDSVGDDLDPLPWRNGHGASVLGPWNKDRSRQNPDLVRPPSTDHGDLANMRWSFADSHIRIEVC